MAKYLLGQTPAYASYMAFGCGPKALKTISYTPTTKAVVSTTATLTITASTHEIVVGDYVTVSGVGYGLDGVFQVTGVTTTTISYATTVTAFAQEAIPATGTAFVSKNYSNKTNLDLEMFRAPIISKGYVVENGISKIVLTADLPTDERYEITEIGIFPAESNSLNGTYDSKIISSFSNSEGWKYSGTLDIPNIIDSIDPVPGIINPKVFVSSSNVTIGTVSGSGPYTATITGLDSSKSYAIAVGDPIGSTGITGNFGSGTVTVASIVSSTSITISSTATFTPGTVSDVYVTNKIVFFTNSDNSAFTYPARVQKQERPRYLNNSIIVRGDASQIAFGTPPTLSTSATGNRISLPIILDLTKNNLSDEFRLGFSVLSKDITSANTISTAKILVEFATNNAVLAGSSREYARMEISVANGTSAGQADFPNNRYVVASKKLSDLVYSPSFSWDTVQYINVYVSVDGSDGNNSANFYVALDMLRLENTSQNNPVYGLTGYTVVKNLSTDGTYGAPIIKNTNTSNFVEFRFNMDVK